MFPTPLQHVISNDLVLGAYKTIDGYGEWKQVGTYLYYLCVTDDELDKALDLWIDVSIKYFNDKTMRPKCLKSWRPFVFPTPTSIQAWRVVRQLQMLKNNN